MVLCYFSRRSRTLCVVGLSSIADNRRIRNFDMLNVDLSVDEDPGYRACALCFARNSLLVTQADL
jgi:hypothetical protein